MHFETVRIVAIQRRPRLLILVWIKSVYATSY